MMCKSICVFLAAFILFFGSFSAQATEPESSAYKEIGLTLGTPSAVNLVLGYWSEDSFPWLVRISGMDFGSTRGIQADFGWAFSRESAFKQYLALSFTTARLDDNDDFDTTTLAGPTYGFNWHGFAVQAGILFGNYQGYDKNRGVTTNSPVEATFQIGYSFLW